MIHNLSPNGGGQPQPRAPGAPQQAPQPGPHDEMAMGLAKQHLDPENVVQMTLLDRVSKLSDQDEQAFVTGCSPAAAAVLKKVLPELAFILDAVMGARPPMPGGGAQPMPAAAPAPQPRAAMPPQGQPQAAQMPPARGLSRF